MKLSFVALALLATRATAIPVTSDDATDSQITHGPANSIVKNTLATGELLSLGKRGEEGDDQSTHDSFEVRDILGVLKTAPAEVLPLLLQELPIALEELPKEVLDKLKSLPVVSLTPELLSKLGSLAPVKRDAAADVGGLVAPVESLLKELLGTVEKIAKGGTKELSKELSDALSLLKGILGEILKSDNKSLDKEILDKASGLKNSLDSLE